RPMPLLKNNQRCPIHHGSRTCCGRAQETPRAPKKSPKWEGIGPGIRKYPDGRIVKTPAALKRRKDFLLKIGVPCAACGEKFEDYREVELAHRFSKGMGGFKRQDSDDNTVLLHRGANREQGSMDLHDY